VIQAAQLRRRQPPLVERHIVVRERRDDGREDSLLVDEGSDLSTSRAPQFIRGIVVPVHHLAPDIPRRKHRVIDAEQVAVLSLDDLVILGRDLDRSRSP
jgi:hypothetical protein